jgi:hypothetical protein
MVLAKGAGLDASLGDRKNALLAPAPNTRAQQIAAANAAHHYSHGDDDFRALMAYLFAPMRPATPHGTGRRHPAECSCDRCRIRRGKRAKTQTMTKGEAR